MFDPTRSGGIDREQLRKLHLLLYKASPFTQGWTPNSAQIEAFVEVGFVEKAADERLSHAEFRDVMAMHPLVVECFRLDSSMLMGGGI